LMAVEMWATRDHDAEWKQWSAWLDHIARRVSTVDGVTTTVVQPEGLSNRTPSLQVQWDRERLGVSGELVADMLLEADPRIALFPARGDTPAQTGVSITPYMLAAGEEKIVADALRAVLANPPRKDPVTQPAAPAADLTGPWDIRIEYAAGASTHALFLRQRGNALDGSHRGDFITRDVAGTIEGDRLRIRSTYPEEHGDALSFTFSGTVTGDTMSGALDMGEYRTAAWTGTRRGPK